MGLLKELDVPADATLCEGVCGNALEAFQMGQLGARTVRAGLISDATDEDSQRDHKDLKVIRPLTDATAIALLEIIQQVKE